MGVYGSPELNNNFTLNKCKHCDNEFFINMSACPKCGKKVKSAATSFISEFITKIFKLIIFILKIAICGVLILFYFYKKNNL
jgi:hypothetical protein